MDQVERPRRDLAHCRADHQHDLHGNFQDTILPDDDPRDRWHGESQEWVEKQWSDCLNYGNAIPGLQLRQLDRHWDRLLFGHEQSGLNHDGRPHHGDSYFHS